MFRHRGHDGKNDMVLVLVLFITAVVPLWRSVWILPELSLVAYYLPFCLLCCMVLVSGRLHLNWSVVWFLGWCAASIMVNTFSAYFSPWSRLGSLALLIAGVGPMFRNYRLYVWRRKSVDVLLWGFVTISVISFILYYVARPIVMYRGFLFMGITGNSMLLAPIAALGALYLMQWYMKSRRRMGIIWRILTAVACAVCVFAMILAGSRSALLSFVITVLLWLWLYLRSVKRYVWVVLAAGAVMGASAPLWSNYTQTLEDKMESSKEAGGLLASREALWQQRWLEFESTPVFGIGFSKVERTTLNEDTAAFGGGSGVVEPGNGWLFVLSSTGIVGFLLLGWIYLSQIIRLWRIKNHESILILSILIFIGIHSFAEGYMLSSGNLLCFMFWLALGVSVCMPRPVHRSALLRNA